MKDLYSFHVSGEDRDRYYEVMRKAYLKIFKRLELDVIETKASGGTFSELSQEFQVIAESGEDTIYYCPKCKIGINKEVHSGKEKCQKCGGGLTEGQAVEVGNIFPLKKKFAEDFKLTFKDKGGKEALVEAGCYGLGTSRVMGTAAEVFNDSRDASAGEKFADADLIGIPFRAVISNKTSGKIELKERNSKVVKFVKSEDLIKKLNGNIR